MNNIERIALSVQKNKTMKKDNHKKYSKLIQKRKHHWFFLLKNVQIACVSAHFAIGRLLC